MEPPEALALGRILQAASNIIRRPGGRGLASKAQATDQRGRGLASKAQATPFKVRIKGCESINQNFKCTYLSFWKILYASCLKIAPFKAEGS